MLIIPAIAEQAAPIRKDNDVLYATSGLFTANA
jgi:hypothetical protein